MEVQVSSQNRGNDLTISKDICFDDNLSEIERKLKAKDKHGKHKRRSYSSESRSRSRSLKSQKKVEKKKSKKRHHHSKKSKKHRHRSESKDNERSKSAHQKKKSKHKKEKSHHKEKKDQTKDNKKIVQVTDPKIDIEIPTETKEESAEKSGKKQKKDSQSISVKRDNDKQKRRSKKQKKHQKKSPSSSSSLSFQSNWSDSSERRRDRRRKKRRSNKVRSKYYHYSSSPERDPLQKYKQNYINNSINDPSKPRQFWDGFQWVTKNPNSVITDPSTQIQTKKMRRVVISNLPIYLGLREKDVRDLVTDFIKKNFLNDPGNPTPVIACEQNSTQKSATIELSTVEEASRLSKISSINMLSVKCKITKVAESMFGPTTSLGTLIEQAQTTAKAQAIAHNAMNSLLGDLNTMDQQKVGRLNIQQVPTSKVIKVMNLVEPEMAKCMDKTDLKGMFEDIIIEFGKHAEVVTGFVVLPQHSIIGAEPGCLFIELEDITKSQIILDECIDLRYKGRLIKMTCIPDDVYVQNFSHLATLN